MKNKIFATIGGAVAALCPWVTHAETFPTDGNMLENKTYESAATYANLGTYAGPVSAAAEYADILYQVGAGQYLPAGSEGVGAVCTAGNYCPGLTNATYSASGDQGLTACPDGYPMSESGASVNTQCYTPCTDASVIAHATAVAGNNYYGNGVDTCYATACDNGYHVNGTVNIIERNSLATEYLPKISEWGYGYIDQNGGVSGVNNGLTENNSWTVNHSSSGFVHGYASCQSSLSPQLEAFKYYSGMIYTASATADEVRAEIKEYVDVAKADVVAGAYAEYKAGTKTKEEALKVGYAVLSIVENADFSTSDSGQYCFCRLSAEILNDGTYKAIMSAPWVFRYDGGSADDCANNCAKKCANSLHGATVDSRVYRAAEYGILGTRVVNICAANEISITWADADPADVAANNAGVCTYDGDIRTPVKAITKPGKTFKGWKFQKSN